MKEYLTVNSADSYMSMLERVKAAQRSFSTYSQEQVDKIFKEAAMASNRARIYLAKMAVEETGMGVVEDKVIKNHLAAEFVYNKYKDEKTCGVIDADEIGGIEKVASPVGVIGAVIPTTNPTSTVIFKALLALKTRNGIIISPHPRAKKSTVEAAKIVLEAAVSAGAPKDIIGWINMPDFELTNLMMSTVDIILATGGPGMVKASYSSGKPAIGVGSGNTPAIIDESANIVLAVNSIIHSKTFDNGMICASEQAVIVPEGIYQAVKDEFIKRGCYFLNSDETEKIRKAIIVNGSLNPEIVGQSAYTIAELARVSVDPQTKILIGETESTEAVEELAHEKLSPVLAMYRVSTFEQALEKAEKLIELGGLGHTVSVFLDENLAKSRVDRLKEMMKACRILVNTPSSHGGVGDVYNFILPPSYTLGCGTWGGNSTSENVGVKHLLNIKTVAKRRENMLWFKVPQRVYIKRGCTRYALEEIGTELNKKRAIIVTDSFLFENGYAKPITDMLAELGIEYTVFSKVEPDPTLSCAKEGAERMREFKPDVIIAFGGGSPMDAAKIMWVLYEHPDVDFEDMAMRFADIRKRIYKFPKMGEKAYFVAIPTSAGTGSEVTPFAVITDDKSGVKYPLADYELLPDMAIVDMDFHMSAPRSLTAASGIDAVTHALEAYVSVMATDYTDGLALRSLKMIFEYLPRVYENGSDCMAREKMANAATMAGISFANAFLGVCHSMAHKLGAYHHLPHGVANALMINEVIRFNATEKPNKMGTFSQYDHPMATEKYAEVASYLGLKGETDRELVEALICKIDELKEKVGIKGSIKEYGVTERDFFATLDEMVEQAFDDQCTGANPRYPLMVEIKQMYINAYYGNKR